jgi:hypothetical protein
MTWGLTVGIFFVALLFAFIGFVIFQEARTHRFWRRRVEEGDLEMIGQLVRAEVERWRTERPPKGMAASVWQGVQGVELIELGSDYIRASTTAEPVFALVGGSRRQVSSALDEARRITAHLAERFFYDVPHVRPDRVQIDVYTTFHSLGDEATQRCIMSTIANRTAAAEVDWDNDPPEVTAERLGARYQTDLRGEPVPIDPDEETVRISVNGSRSGPDGAFF